ncbi:MAG TPA: hypothetical protein VGM50_17595 [Gemmatimonadaceae bacterium]|jgi:hypothetical protein
MLMKRVARLAGLAVALVSSACAKTGIVDVSASDAIKDQTILVGVGQEVDLTIQTVGPGGYSDHPSISSNAAVFLGVEDVGLAVPAGPRVRFRFRGITRGDAVVRIPKWEAGSVVATLEDTLRVR